MLGAALKRRRRAIILPTLLAFVLISIFVNVVTPRYTAESSILLENQETFFTRPDRSNLPSEQTVQLDPEAVASQVQLINSRDIARRAIDELQLNGNSEFDPIAGGIGPLSRVLILLGLMSDPTRESIDSRIVSKFLEKLTVYSPPKTRVLVIQFTSRDADLAARAANTVARLYMEGQSAAKRATAKSSSEALAAQITDLKAKLIAADDEREQYRQQSGLLAGSNNMTISGQQLADINSDLSKARTQEADAQAKASLIRDLLRSGKPADVADVINNETVRRIADQRVQAQAQMAREGRTYLPGHPRMKELAGQVAEYDIALKIAAKQAEVSLENDAKIAGQRVENLQAVLAQQKQVTGIANTDEVHLRALERISQSYKDQLDSSTAKYQEALARQSSAATPADARIISSAATPQEPSYPKKVPFIVFGTVATFVFAIGFVVASELLSGGASIDAREEAIAEAPLPVMTAPTTTASAAPTTTPAAPMERQAWTFPPDGPADEKISEEKEPDPVFAPVEPEREARVDGAPKRTAASVVAATRAYFGAFGKSAAASRLGESDTTPDMTADPAPDLALDPVPGAVSACHADEAPPAAAIEAEHGPRDMSDLAGRIVSAHVPGRGLHIVGATIGGNDGVDMLIKLASGLSAKGRAIIVDLNRTPAALAPLAGMDDENQDRVASLAGLAELLAGDASFAEVIHRAQGSRLHFIPTGQQSADFQDFDLILDALSETYDFIVLLAPALPRSEIAKIIAPHADFAVLAGTEGVEDDTVVRLRDELVRAGTREVFILGEPPVVLHQDVA